MVKNRSLRVAGAALISFAALGTVSALWPNPLFVRMTPVQGFEIWLLLLQSVLIGLYAAVRRAHCPVRKAGFGSVVAAAGVILTALALASEYHAARSEATRDRVLHSRLNKQRVR